MTIRSPNRALTRPGAVIASAAGALALGLFVMAAQPLRAQSPAGPQRAGGPPLDRQVEDRWWRDHALIPRLDLEPARRARLEETYAAARTRLDALNAAVAAAEADLAAVTHAVAPDERAFAPRLERMATAREQLEKEHVGLLLTVRGLLTPAQWARLRELQRTLSGSGPAGGPPRPPAPGGDPPQPPPPASAPHDGRPRAGGPPPPDAPMPGGPPAGSRPGQLPPGPPLPPGTWWRDPELSERLGIDPSQADELDAAFEARRASLADARAALEREERALGALLPGPALDLDAALAASARVAHTRAQLDRAFLALRFSQWRTLRAEQRERLLRPGPPSSRP